MKNVKTNRIGRFALMFAIVGLTAFAIAAQGDQRFAVAQQQNALALRKYEWKSRTEIQKDGETKNVQVTLMRYDSNGNLEKNQVSSTEQDLPKFGIRGLVAQKKKKAFMEKLDELRALAKSYSELPPDKMQRFMANAEVTPEITAAQKLVRIEGRSVLQPSDSMTLWLDAVSRKQRRVMIHTFLNDDPVRIVSEFQDLPGGPTYVARSQVNLDGTAVVIITENFDYTLNQSARDQSMRSSQSLEGKLNSQYPGLSALRFIGSISVRAAAASSGILIGRFDQV